jgi:hypothetical protein
MKFDNPNLLTFSWGREGLHISYNDAEIGVLDCYDLARLKISYGDDLDETPSGWFMSRREKVIKWLKQTEAE